MGPAFYADLFVLYNFLVDALLLWAVASLAGRPIRIARLVGSAFIGGIAALLPYIPGWPASFTVGYAFVLAFLLVHLAFSVQNFQVFFRLTSLFWLVSFLYGGVTTFLETLGSQCTDCTPSSTLASHASWGALLLGYVLMFSLGKVTFLSFERGGRGASQRVQGVVRIQDREVRFLGLVDTGHMLRDPLGNAPVFLADMAFFLRLFPELEHLPHVEKVFDQLAAGRITYDLPEGLSRRFRLLPYRSVGGTGLLPAFVVDEVFLETEHGYIRIPHARLGLSAHPLFADAIADVLVSADVLHECKGEGKKIPGKGRKGHAGMANPRV